MGVPGGGGFSLARFLFLIVWVVASHWLSSVFSSAGSWSLIGWVVTRRGENLAAAASEKVCKAGCHGMCMVALLSLLPHSILNLFVFTVLLSLSL